MWTLKHERVCTKPTRVAYPDAVVWQSRDKEVYLQFGGLYAIGVSGLHPVGYRIDDGHTFSVDIFDGVFTGPDLRMDLPDCFPVAACCGECARVTVVADPHDISHRCLDYLGAEIKIELADKIFVAARANSGTLAHRLNIGYDRFRHSQTVVCGELGAVAPLTFDQVAPAGKYRRCVRCWK
jgi:hypothetical protein